MTAKEELKKIASLQHQIDRLKQREQAIRENMASLRSSAGHLAADKVQTSHSNDRILNYITQIEEIEEQILKSILTLEKEKDLICLKIEAIKDERYKNILFCRYVLFYDYEDIAAKMGYSLRQIFNLHAEALNEYANM